MSYLSTLRPAGALLVLATLRAGSAQAPLPQLGKASVEEVVRALTLEEKAALVVGTGTEMVGNSPVAEGTAAAHVVRRVAGAAGNTYAIPRLGIPAMALADGPAGVRIDSVRAGSSRKFYATAFPVGTALASSWDTTLVRQVGQAMGSEVRAYGLDVLLGPGMNIQRNPLGGRNFEYLSEDPRVSGHMAAALVRGLQANGVGATIKHFVANNQETSRSQIDTRVSERALREIYLKGFEIAVKQAQPWTVMSSYNRLNGTFTSERADLLTTILREEWGFRGLVMSDWYAGRDAAAQVRAGNDLLMPGPNQAKKIVAAVTDGTLDPKLLDRNVTRVLQLILRSPAFQRVPATDAPRLAANAQLVRRAGAEGMVLLQNQQGVLPLKSGAKVAAFGTTTYDFLAGGGGSGEVNKAYTTALPAGLRGAGFALDAPLTAAYQQYITQSKAARPPRLNLADPVLPLPEMPVTDAQIAAAAAANEVGLLTLGRYSIEGTDRKLTDFYLTDVEKSLVQRLSSAFHAQGKKLVVVLNIGGVVEVASWRAQADGILLAWQPGLEAGNSVADVLSGKVNPSGKLAVSFPADYPDVPSANSFPGTPANRPTEVTYSDGIYVGYRYYSTFRVKPAYEFGYGLSYSTFTYSKPKLSSKKFSKQLAVKVTVTNAGAVAGREVVQLYLSAPGKTLPKPVTELKAFGKTQLLQPGRSQTLTFVLTPAELASFDTARSAWVAEAGTYTIALGSSSADTRQTAAFALPLELLTEQVHKALAPVAPINELTK